jgi:hypothetical protein
MELACDIIRKKNKGEDVFNLVKQLREIKIGEKNNIMESKELNKKLIPIINSIFENSKEISESIVFAYYVSSTPKELIEKHTKSIINSKLIYASNSLVAYIEYFGNETNSNEFFETIDYFFSQYKTWKSFDLFAKIDDLYNMLEDDVKLYFMSKRVKSKKKSSVKSNSLKLVDTIFSIHPRIAAKKLLSNYEVVSSVPSIKNRIWENISDISTDSPK